MFDRKLIQYYDDNLRNSNNIKHVSDCGVILTNQSMTKILLVLQRSSLKWGLPKGHMTRNEIQHRDYFACASRELQEETGIILSKTRYYLIGQIIINHKMFYVIKLLTQNIDYEPIDTDEILGVGWVEQSNIFEFVKSNNCNRTLKELAQMCEEMIKKQSVKYAPPSVHSNLIESSNYNSFFNKNKGTVVTRPSFIKLSNHHYSPVIAKHLRVDQPYQHLQHLQDVAV